MLRRQYKKRRNKKGGRSFFDAFSQGTSQIKSAAEKAKDKGMEAAANTRQGFADFEASRQANVRSMVAGELNLLKIRSKDPFARSGKPIGQREVLNPLNPQVQTEALSRQSAYDTAMVDFKKKTHQIAGRRKTKKRRIKRKKKKTKRKKRRRKRKTKKRRRRR